MSQKLHILFLSSWYPSRVFPINGDFVQRHAEAVSLKNDVTVIHVVTDAKITSIETTKSVINHVKTIIVYIPEKKSILKFYAFFKAYISEIKAIENFDIVHLNVTFPIGVIALYLKLFYNKNYIISEHWTGYQYPQNKTICFLKKQITKLIVKKASLVCPVSKQLENDMKKFGLKGVYKPVSNVVNTDLFVPVSKNKNPFIITHISSFNDKQKNITGILNVISKLSKKRKNFVFNIVGNGDLLPVINSVKKLKIPSKNIQVIGTKTQEEIAKILQKTNLYISFSNYETFGIVMAEALATGTPVISTNTGILTELDASEFSKIIPINDEEKLYDNILYFMDNEKPYDPKKMHLLIEQNFSKVCICNDFTELYFSILKDSNKLI